MDTIIPLAAIFFSSMLVALSGAVMPGPVFTAVVSESTRRGASAGPLFMSGHALLELALVFAIIYGLGPFLALRQVFMATALAGGIIMLCMGISIFIAIPRLEPDFSAREKQYGKVLLTAMILSLSNPYWTVWWVTIGLGFLQKSMLYGIAGGLSFYFGHIAGDFLWYSMVSFGVAKGRKFLDTFRYRILIGVCAGILCFFAAVFIWSGITAAAELELFRENRLMTL